MSAATDAPEARLAASRREASRAGLLAEALAGYGLAAPAIVGLIVLFVIPVLAVFVIAATDWQFGARTLSFVGLKNFVALAADDTFHRSLLNTLLYGLVVVPVTVLGGLAVALLIESVRSFRTFYRAIHFMPYMATLAAMAIVWEALLHPTIGLATQAIAALGLPTANWLHDERTVLWALAGIGVWQNLGFAMVLFLAGLKSIPAELYDAAAVDGADGPMDRLHTVTLPLLGPVTMFVVIVTALKTLRVFDTVAMLTQGGPSHASETLLYTLYSESFLYLHTGYGAAVTVTFLAIVIALTLLQARLLDRRVHYS